MSDRQQTWLWWSTGKDSAWSLQALRKDEAVEVTALVTTITDPFDRVSMHGVRHAVLRAQAKAMGLPLRIVRIPEGCSNEVYEQAVGNLLDQARTERVERMAFGDLFLADVRRYRETLLSQSGIEPMFPIWGGDTRELAERMLAQGLEAWVTCVDTRVLPASLAGRRYDQSFLDELGGAVDPCGENGEFHTCVVNGPMFGQAVSVELGEIVVRKGFAFADLTLRSPLDPAGEDVGA